MQHRYQPYYCEENIYCLAQNQLAQAVAETPAWAVFISNPSRSCLLFEQRAAPVGHPVCWDYHVVLVVPPFCYDFDHRPGFKTPLADYLLTTFHPATPPDLRAFFRVLPAAEFLRFFSTDRRHMRSADGGWLKPPPAWPAPRGFDAASDHELPRFTAMDRTNDNDRYGEVLTLIELKRKFMSSGGCPTAY